MLLLIVKQPIYCLSGLCSAEASPLKNVSWQFSGLLCLSVLSFGLVTCGAAAKPHAEKPHAGVDAYYDRGRYPSPDRKFVARIVHHEVENTESVSIIDVKTGKVVIEADDVHGCRWVPGHPHRLVVAGWAVFGEGMLAMWESGTRWRSLVQVSNPDREAFTLYGISRDGCSITYGHKRDFHSNEPLHDRSLRLPGAGLGRRTAAPGP
jgi:hypothetical protein